MNKQEAMDVIESISYYEKVNRNPLEDLVNKIYDDLKPVVPKFVAEWIEEAKNMDFCLADALASNSTSTEVDEWLYRENDKNEETFARAWLDGYEVEKEKLYEVIIPHTSNYKNQKQYLVKQGKNWFFCGNDVNRFKYKFTKCQIEAAGFGWVFEKGFTKEV